MNSSTINVISDQPVGSIEKPGDLTGQAFAALREETKRISTATKAKHWHEYQSWLEQNAKPVKLESWVLIPPVIEVLNEFKRVPPKPKECFDNAARLALFANGVEYVEGFAFHQDRFSLVRHAWNRLGPLSFDVTYELACGFDLTKIQYLEVITLSESSDLLWDDDSPRQEFETRMDAYWRIRISKSKLKSLY